MVFLSSHYPDQLWGTPSLLSNGYWAILNLYHPCVAAYMWSMWPYISQYHTATPLGPAGNSIVKGFKFLIPIWERLTIGCFILNQRSNRIIICFAVLYWDHIFVCTCALPSCTSLWPWNEFRCVRVGWMCERGVWVPVVTVQSSLAKLIFTSLLASVSRSYLWHLILVFNTSWAEIPQ
jgi:hypothetical protein